MNHQHFHQCIFWLYYTRGLLQAKLKHHNDAIGSFTASIDTNNYAQVLMGNLELAKKELTNHRQILQSAEKTIANKSNSSSDIAIKAASVKLVEKYKQVIMFFQDILNKNDSITPLDFGLMFDIPLVENKLQNDKLQCGYAHYHKGISQIALNKQKEALKSFNEANKLLPDFCSPYIQKANIYREQKKYIKSVSQYDAAIRIENNNAGLYFNRSLVLFELGKPLEAKNDFNKYQSLNSAKN
jgi:tetratricopeptide (TPR) repeat protein